MNKLKKRKEEIKQIVRQNGGKEFIIIDSKGSIVQQEITSSKIVPDALAKLMLTIKDSASIIGKHNFKTFTISRENGQNIFIIPIGKFYLGVIKSTDIKESSNRADQQVYHHLNDLIIELTDKCG